MLQDTSIIQWKAYELFSSYQNKINDIIQLQFAKNFVDTININDND